jgi:hypothetical protein
MNRKIIDDNGTTLTIPGNAIIQAMTLFVFITLYKDAIKATHNTGETTINAI